MSDAGVRIIRLPEVSPQPSLSLEQAIQSRRSLRRFTGKPMTLAELARLLHFSCGITDHRYGFRAAPSAGATYPIETYPVVNAVEGLEPGVYRYDVADHALRLMNSGDFRQQMVSSAVGQSMMGKACVVIALAAVSERIGWTYGKRSYQYMCFEAGHIAQNIYLMAVAMGMGSCAVGAFDDDHYDRILGLDGTKESVLYLMAVGKV